MKNHTTSVSQSHALTTLTEISPYDSSWAKFRAGAETVAGVYQLTALSQYSSRMISCGQNLGFLLVANKSGEVRPKLHSAHFCRVRMCPMCQWRRSQKWRARFYQALPKIFEANPTANYVFLTLTIKNCDISELRSTIKHLHDGWRKLRQRKNYPAIGAVRNFEVTAAYDWMYGSQSFGTHGEKYADRLREDIGTPYLPFKTHKTLSRQVNPHLHVLLMTSPSYFAHEYVKHAEWVDMWQSCLGVEYKPVVDIRAMRTGRTKAKISDELRQSLRDDGIEDKYHAVAAAAQEVLKYSVKPLEMQLEPWWLEEVTTQLAGLRAISLTGEFKKHIKSSEPENLIDEGTKEENPDEHRAGDIFGRWDRKVGDYVMYDS